MKLYDIPRQCKIIVELSDGSSYLIFDKIDGAYSYCVTEMGNVVHLSANTELVSFKKLVCVNYTLLKTKVNTYFNHNKFLKLTFYYH